MQAHHTVIMVNAYLYSDVFMILDYCNLKKKVDKNIYKRNIF